MDKTKLVVGQEVFMRSGGFGDWGKVVRVMPTGVIVQSDPSYGDELIRFDENGMARDSSDIGVDEYKDLVLFDGDFNEAPCDTDVDIARVKNIVSQYVEGTGIPRAVCGDRREFRQRFWENFERLKKHSRYSKIPGHGNPWKLYLNWGSQEL
jgi:hypothetical protein